MKPHPALRQLAAQVDRKTARTAFKVSGPERVRPTAPDAGSVGPRRVKTLHRPPVVQVATSITTAGTMTPTGIHRVLLCCAAPRRSGEGARAASGTVRNGYGRPSWRARRPMRMRSAAQVATLEGSG